MKCEGCGVEIQTEDPKKPGYIPENVLKEKIENNESVVCQRCFKLKHYNYLLPITINSDFSREIDKILRDFETVLWVVDVIDFEGTFIKEIAEKIKGKNIFLIVNKIDLLPKSTPYEKLKDWLLLRIKEMGINIPGDHVRMVSVKTGMGIEKTKRLLLQTEKEKALVVGVTNVGKSSFLNSVVKGEITVSAYSGTTLKVLKAKVPNTDIQLFDTPGIFTQDRLCDFFDIYTQVKMIPSKKIKIKTFTVNEKNVLFISGLFWLKVLKNGVNNLPPIITVFLPEEISAHRAKEERVNDLLHNREVLFPPYDDNFDFDQIEFERGIVKIDKGNDLALPGAGWLSIKRGPLVAEISKPKGLRYVVRKSMK
ncbi:ribosome biogenesis GTPase YqeH [Petrotoga miotherma DSM 10691]|uniref:Ribosome biogenesis GTPase YqeH n=1 Tax=Petrotoga miotherma DSM 10691 TaxID=1434326 RepID=A0A2K1P6Q9_9BACT|nr:ribosome biogenesis GTPase YqeH [Petrotoga miotherma]PNR98484.1 ribosome biogenesis GTPase YqeH [Petrotoga miotherma DSM 10691]